jgi:hypothetical protein
VTRELHPLLRLDLELVQERGRRQRELRARRAKALQRPEARAEWEQADQLSPDLFLADAEEWIDGLVDVAKLNDVDPHDAAALCALRDRLLQAAEPERADAYAGLLALTDEVIELAVSRLRQDG